MSEIVIIAESGSDVPAAEAAELGIEMAKSEVSHTVEEAVEIASRLGYPCVLRPAYTMGGTGGGLVYNVEELRTVASYALDIDVPEQPVCHAHVEDVEV